MDNNQAKLILSVYRPNGADAQDPLFREALKQAESDPTLRHWLAEQQAFDGQLASALATIQGPEEGKAMIPLTTGAPRRRRVIWAWPLALAASVALLFALSFGLAQRNGLSLPENASLAELATTLSDRLWFLGRSSPDYPTLRAWIAEKGGPLPGQLPPGLAKLAPIGCETWTTSRGRISLICFTSENGQTIHLYVFEQIPGGLDERTLPAAGQPRFENSGDWSLALWQDNGHGYVLAQPAEANRAPNMERYFRS